GQVAPRAQDEQRLDPLAVRAGRRGVGGAHPANSLTGTPRTPGTQAKRAPASGSAPGSRCSREVVMNSRTRPGPPKAHAVTWVTGSSTTSSRATSGAYRRTEEPPYSGHHTLRLRRLLRLRSMAAPSVIVAGKGVRGRRAAVPRRYARDPRPATRDPRPATRDPRPVARSPQRPVDGGRCSTTTRPMAARAPLARISAAPRG